MDEKNTPWLSRLNHSDRRNRRRPLDAGEKIGGILRRWVSFLLFASLLAACKSTMPPPPDTTPSSEAEANIIGTPVLQDGPTGTLPKLSSGWTKIEPRGDTACAHGTPYAFWVRPGTLNKLLVYFQGGGGCWSAETCRPDSPSYDDSVADQDAPTRERGILDLNNPENPFKDYSVVYLPYCTGDLHWGSNVQTYHLSSNDTLIIRHKGFVNASVALTRAYRYFPAPKAIFVTGWSAGAIGSILFAPYLIKQYPQAAVAQLGDSLSFAFDRPPNLQRNYRAHDNFPDWIPALADIQPETFTMARFYAAIAHYYPQHTFAQYNTAYDHAQERYFVLAGGSAGSFGPALQISLDDIHMHARNFRSYTAPGTTHGILLRRDFYRLETAGVRLRDWVAALANHQQVGNVHCKECEGHLTSPSRRKHSGSSTP